MRCVSLSPFLASSVPRLLLLVKSAKVWVGVGRVSIECSGIGAAGERARRLFL